MAFTSGGDMERTMNLRDNRKNFVNSNYTWSYNGAYAPTPWIVWRHWGNSPDAVQIACFRTESAARCFATECMGHGEPA